MTSTATLDRYGTLVEPDTLEIKRRLPGPIDRVWSYLTDSDKRSRWLASGSMEPRLDSAFTLTWRNDTLTDPPGTRPPGMQAEHSLESRLTAFDPPRRLGFTWGKTGGVTIDLEPQGEDVLLTLVHRRVPDRAVRVNVSAGWHAHLDMLAARLANAATDPFWDGFSRLKAEYERRTPA